MEVFFIIFLGDIISSVDIEFDFGLIMSIPIPTMYPSLLSFPSRTDS